MGCVKEVVFDLVMSYSLPLISPLHWREGLRPRIAIVLGGVGSLGDIVSA